MVARALGAVRRFAGVWVMGAVFGAAGCGGSSEHGDDDAAGASNDAGQGGTGTGGGSGARGGTGGSAAGGRGGTGGSAAAGSGGTGGNTDPNHGLVQVRTAAVDKVDVLLVVDNSLGMADKQVLLAEALPVLVERLIQPECRDAEGNLMTSADGTCPAGTAPEFDRVRNLHVGVITSSLGDHGSGDVCSQAQNDANVTQGLAPSQYNDLAQLLPSVRTGVVSWNNSAFLVWDPRVQAEVQDPHANLTKNETDPSAFVTNLADQVLAAGQHGCGYEGSLEAWYRFLVDPEPMGSMSHDSVTSVSVRGSLNRVVLAQRATFLRPDSALLVVMLSDENDCSIVDEDDTQGWLVGYKGGVNAGAQWHMPRSSAACATNPNDPCCRPCISAPPAACPANDADSSCSQGATLATNEDSMNLRCYRQAERFGISLLYPTARYTEALTSQFVRPRPGGAQVLNPLYQPSGGVRAREPGMVILGGILGVPWQDLSTESSWSGEGLEYLDANRLEAEGRWDVILGDPATNRLPTDTLMVESIDPRTSAPYPQAHPLIDAEVGAADAETLTNPINGHEHATLPIRDDLQYACIFELSIPVVCTDQNADACECNHDEFTTNSPLCEGVTETTDGTQRFAKAYPSLRQLEVLKSVADTAVVASICPKHAEPRAGASKQSDPNYGYNPAMSALAAKLGTVLRPRCLPRALPIDEPAPRAACTVLEARPMDGACTCTLPGRSDVSDEEASAVRTELRSLGGCAGAECDTVCVCELEQLDGAALERCQSGLPGDSADYGFCYIDPEHGLGSEAAVASCDASSKRLLRFVGEGVPQKAGFTFLDCVAN